MKKRISKQMLGIAVLTMVVSIILMVGVFYKLFQNQVILDLKTDAHILEITGVLEDGKISPDNLEEFNNSILGIRVTLIDANGEVLFDSLADSAQMDNHGNRPEVKAAIEKGEGRSIRESSTLNKSTYYYAVKETDGHVLRVAKEAHSMWSILYSALFPIIFVVICLMLICFALSRILTKSIVEPIENLAKNLNRIDEIESYEELRPFIETIAEQHEAIIKNANMRQDFTANVTHELKTPLTAISGYSELIENGMADSETTIRFAAGIHQNANRLLTLINDIIRLSELDVTKEVEMEEIDLYQFANNSVEMLQMSAENRNVTLSLEGHSSIVKANRQMLEELLYNLCDNAIRYNNKGGHVWVRVGQDNGSTFLEVKDTGIGISKEHQERIFERFYRVDKSRSKETGGTGLGLAIVKHIVAQHEAKVEINSEEGKGTDIKIIFCA